MTECLLFFLWGLHLHLRMDRKRECDCRSLLFLAFTCYFSFPLLSHSSFIFSPPRDLFFFAILCPFLLCMLLYFALSLLFITEIRFSLNKLRFGLLVPSSGFLPFSLTSSSILPHFWSTSHSQKSFFPFTELSLYLQCETSLFWFLRFSPLFSYFPLFSTLSATIFQISI